MTNATRLACLAGAVWVASVSGLAYGAITWALDMLDAADEMLAPPKETDES